MSHLHIFGEGKTTASHFMYEETWQCIFWPSFAEKFNVLWRENWTRAAGKVLRKFEVDVIEKTKDGYDGGDENDENVQWSFTGALLYSVTVITTIGKKCFACLLNS